LGSTMGSFSADPHWRHVQRLSQEEKTQLESKWEERHDIAFSRMNHRVNPGLRDYFDRPREWKDHPTILKKGGVYHPWWKLDCGQKRMPTDGWSLGDEAQGMRSKGRCPSKLSRRKAWNEQHHLTVSRDNERNCDACREYFGRFTEPQGTRWMIESKRGLTKHYLPHAQVGNPDGCDQSIPLDGGDHPYPDYRIEEAETFIAGMESQLFPAENSAVIPSAPETLVPVAMDIQ